MKIAVWHNLPSGGGKRALYDHVRGLIERGHTVESWCPSTADQTYLPLSELITEHVLPFSWQPRLVKNRFDEIKNLYLNVTDLIEAMDQHCRQCAEEINNGGFDLVFVNTSMFLAVSSIGRHIRIPNVLYLQEPCRHLYESALLQENYRQLSETEPHLPWLALPEIKGASSLRKIKRLPRDLMQTQGIRVQAREEWLSARAFDAVLVNSFFSRESVLRAYGLDAKVCYLGIDADKFTNQHQEREMIIVGIGFIAKWKNIKLVLEALAEVREPRPRLVWVGNGSDKSYMEELLQFARQNGVGFEPRVSVTDEELVNILNRAAMMVYAPRLEPFGFAPLEANACGLPVIGVAEGGLRETIVDGVNGLLVESDAQVMAAAIERLVSDKDYARQLGENGGRIVRERWSLSAAIDRLERRFEEVLAKSQYCTASREKL